MTTGREIVTKMMQKAGIVTKNETPAADEINDALDALNAMVSSWSNDSLLVYTRTWEEFPLVGNVSQYTIGAGQTFDTERPNQILQANVKLSGQTYDTPLSILNDVNFNIYANDATTQGLPEYLNYDGNNPSGIIRLWPVPSTGYTLFILSEKPLTAFTLDGNVDLPPGWERALIYNGAVEIAPEYGQDPSQTTFSIARESLAAIKLASAKMRNMDASPMSGGSPYQVLRGW